MNHRRAVGPPGQFDIIGALQFMFMVNIGLRDTHKLLDVGCGSLRAGKLFIPYLNYGNYYGIEPNLDLVRAGIIEEMGHDVMAAGSSYMEGPKGSFFRDIGSFMLVKFDVKFDFILAHSIFTHAPRFMIERCLAEAYKCMHKDSVFAFTYMEGPDFSGNKFLSGPGTVMATYTTPTIMTMVREAGLFAQCVNYYHPHDQRWVIVVKDRMLFPDPMNPRIIPFNPLIQG